MDINVPAVPTSSRILYDVPCVVCSDHSSGKHYGVYACDGCAGFFKRSVRRQRNYECKSRTPGSCLVNKQQRNQCRCCRLKKCLACGMNRDAVQNERGPRHSTIRRQITSMRNQDSLEPPRYPLPYPNPAAPLPLQILNKYYYPDPSLLNPPIIPFPFYANRSYPTPMVSLRAASSAEETCEAAAKIILINSKWVKDLVQFGMLPSRERLLLVTGTWKDLFVLATGQFLFPLNVKALFNSIRHNIDFDSVDKLLRVMTKISEIKLQIKEFEAIRGMMLFNHHLLEQLEGAGPASSSRVTREIAKAHKTYLDDLTMFINTNHPQDPETRIRDIMKMIRLVTRVRSDVITDLFFRNAIGYNTIEGIIQNMYVTI